MNKKFLTFLIFFVVIFSILTPYIVGAAPDAETLKKMQELCRLNHQNNEAAYNECVKKISEVPGSGANPIAAMAQTGADWLLKPLFYIIGHFLLTISALILIFAGWIFDGVVSFTIINVADYLGSGTDMGKAIFQAWTTLRDIANIFFIFVLIYAALKAMFDLNFGSSGTLIKNIILVALLINFSLFFTKVVIDASNVVSLGFYQSIATANTATVQGANFSGISAGYMKMLGLQTIYGAEILRDGMDAQKVLVVGIMGSLFMLISAIIFLISGIMFATRFVILIFLMILSPLALIAIIIPGGMATFNKWKDALISQSFFAPLFFALTWVTFKLGSALVTRMPAGDLTWVDLIGSSATQKQASVTVMLMNYVLIIGFSIAALVFAKSMATKTAGFTQISGAIGAGAVGATAWAGRQTIGRGGQLLTRSSGLQEAANKERTTFGGRLVGGLARATVYAGEKARSGTFDARNAAIPTSVVGDAIQGTIGRTKIGKAMGLNDVNIPNVKMDAIVKDMDLLGKGGTQGFKEAREESEKRVQEREAAAASEYKISKLRKDILSGKDAPVGSAAIGEMEKALASLSEKETESIVSGNRELLKSLNFANAISVKQLEAINKSDKFSDAEKDSLKSARFKTIDDTMSITDPVARIAAITTIKDNIKNLSDTELEMINSEYLKDEDFVEQLKGSQVDSIVKSKKFTSSQVAELKNRRLAPLLNAIATGATTTSQSIFKKVDLKTKIGYMKEVTPPGMAPITIATHPDILPTYTPKMLQKMAAHEDMSDSDIQKLRSALLGGPAGRGAPGVPAATVTWLLDPNKGGIEFA